MNSVSRFVQYAHITNHTSAFALIKNADVYKGQYFNTMCVVLMLISDVVPYIT